MSKSGVLRTAFKETSLDELNETIEDLGNEDPLVDIKMRYICDDDGDMRTFSFKVGTVFSPVGKKTEYKIRLVRTTRYDVNE